MARVRSSGCMALTRTSPNVSKPKRHCGRARNKFRVWRRLHLPRSCSTGREVPLCEPYGRTLTGYSSDELLTEDAWGWVHTDFRDLVGERARGSGANNCPPGLGEVPFQGWPGGLGGLHRGLVEYGGKPAGPAMASTSPSANGLKKR